MVPDVSSPLLGVSGPPGAEKGGNAECEWQVCVSSTDALVILKFSLFELYLVCTSMQGYNRIVVVIA